MLISNLNHLETLNETPDVVGGSFGTLVDLKITQYNFANVYQAAASFAKAAAVGDDANATAYSSNYSSIDQRNDLDIDV